MEKHELESLLEQADAAWNEEDINSILDTYDEDATLVVQPGMNVRGKQQIRKAVEAIFNHFNHTLCVKQRDITVIEGSETALVLARATISANQMGEAPFVQERKSTYVYRKKPDGRWLCVVDNSYGVDLLS